MKFTKIRYKDGETTLVWLEEQPDDRTVHKHELVSRENPTPEFRKALTALLPQVLDLLELPEEYGSGMRVVSLSLRHPEDAPTQVVVTCMKGLAAVDHGDLVLNTPLLSEQEAWLSPEFLDAIATACHHAERFVGGARAQQDLFEVA